MRLSLRGHGSAPAKSWDELTPHKAGLLGFSTSPSVRPGVMAWPCTCPLLTSSSVTLFAELVAANSSLLHFQGSM